MVKKAAAVHLTRWEVLVNRRAPARLTWKIRPYFELFRKYLCVGTALYIERVRDSHVSSLKRYVHAELEQAGIFDISKFWQLRGCFPEAYPESAADRPLVSVTVFRVALEEHLRTDAEAASKLHVFVKLLLLVDEYHSINNTVREIRLMTYLEPEPEEVV